VRIFKQVLFSSYVCRGDVGGVACDHLAFTESNIDWQIWIQRSGKSLPRKVVINYRTTPGLPQLEPPQQHPPYGLPTIIVDCHSPGGRR
jgi:hypothetical protein